jgi:hypothetical protein
VLTVYPIKEFRLLGKTPTHILREKLLDYFLYVFEINWCSPVYQEKQENVKAHFEKALNELKSQNHELSLGQEWWALVLFSLKDFAMFYRSPFSVQTIQFVLQRIYALQDEELEEYCNAIHYALNMELPEILAIRPLEIQVLQSDVYEEEPEVAFFLNKKEELKQIFSNQLKSTDIKKEYLQQFLMNDEEINLSFTDFWSSFLDVFIIYSLSMLYLMSESQFMFDDDIEELLKEVHLVFLTASIKKKSSIHKLNKELTEIIKPLYIQYFS